MAAMVFDYADIARRMNCDKPQKKEEAEPKKLGRSLKAKSKWPVVHVSDEGDDEDDDKF